MRRCNNNNDVFLFIMNFHRSFSGNVAACWNWININYQPQSFCNQRLSWTIVWCHNLADSVAEGHFRRWYIWVKASAGSYFLGFTEYYFTILSLFHSISDITWITWAYIGILFKVIAKIIQVRKLGGKFTCEKIVMACEEEESNMFQMEEYDFLHSGHGLTWETPVEIQRSTGDTRALTLSETGALRWQGITQRCRWSFQQTPLPCSPSPRIIPPTHVQTLHRHMSALLLR